MSSVRRTEDTPDEGGADLFSEPLETGMQRVSACVGTCTNTAACAWRHTKKTHCRTVPFSNGGQLGCQRLLCLSGSMYVNVKKLSGNTNRGEEGRRRPIQGGLIQQHLPCSAMSHIQFHDDTSSATSSNMNHFTFCHSSSVYSLCPLLITAMTSWRNIQIFSP